MEAEENAVQSWVVVLGYAFLMTVLHTVCVMNTRIRSPLIDPLIATLAGGSWLGFEQRNVATNAKVVRGQIETSTRSFRNIYCFMAEAKLERFIH